MHLRNSDMNPQWARLLNSETFKLQKKLPYNSFVMCHSKTMPDIRLHFAFALSNGI